ncbi:hypothetical protein CLOSTMETH_00305 [[Clostridium] methylpentosum DSM 5476]|jgi:hypothetical protein|uniref:Uncharacterized protein n=1 Tax=[Clostridium] methylpentosum DSM 5476 TaxID=537013 RepID=C0E910_9FIRM|nr:hypothetical protein CLOSTMETH_00305 [[Clostridium] methylpentosum DSM 5476]MDY3988887.1 DUF2624 family protein [Massilioclostridium sp.]MEE1491181.1 DUF2624 family protein [Massilioclostridium sp.]
MLQSILVKIPENQREYLLGRVAVSRTPDEILRLAKEYEIELTQDEAEYLFDLKDDPILEGRSIDMISGFNDPDRSLGEIPTE